MPRNGSGVYSLPSGNPVVTGTVISSTVQNNTMTDVATALTNSIAVDGQSVVTANLPMGGFKHTNVANGSARTDYAALGQLQDGSFIYVATVGGTADVITLTPSPAITSYAAGQTFRFIASGTNTTNVTVNVSGLGAKAVDRNGANALIAGDIASGEIVTIVYDGTQFQFVTTNNMVAIGRNQTVTGTKTFTSAVAVNTTGTANTFSVSSSDAGASAFIGVIIDRNSASPAASDLLGELDFNGKNSGGSAVTYASIIAGIETATAASEDGKLNFATTRAGANGTRGYIGAGLVMGNATGGDKGSGTINADIYDNNNRVYSAANTVPQAGLTNSAVGQAQLKTTTASGSTTLGGTSGGSYSLTGGTYSWWTASCTNVNSIQFGNGDTAAGVIGLYNESGSNATFFVDERYVQASPPYTHSPLFVFLQVDAGGNIISTSVAEDPPWAYHGPTLITPEYYRNGIGYRRVAMIDGKPFKAAMNDRAIFERWKQSDISIEAESVETEITLAYKDSDKDIIPHPFNNIPGATVILLEPSSNLIRKLHDLLTQSDASEVRKLLLSNQIRFDNDRLDIQTLPKSVMAVRASFR